MEKSNNKLAVKTYECVDLVKLIAAILVIGSHALPIFDDEFADYFYGQWFFRPCVPFFMIVSGYFFMVLIPTK